MAWYPRSWIHFSSQTPSIWSLIHQPPQTTNWLQIDFQQETQQTRECHQVQDTTRCLRILSTPKYQFRSNLFSCHGYHFLLLSVCLVVHFFPLDVITTYLYETLDTDLYTDFLSAIRPAKPDKYSGLKIQKSLYGLKQAGYMVPSPPNFFDLQRLYSRTCLNW